MSTLRSEFGNGAVYSDHNDIPAAQRVTYYANCSSKHQGLCRFGDRSNFEIALEIGNRLNEHLLNEDIYHDGDWVNIAVVRADRSKHEYYYLAHQRFMDPRIALLAQTMCFPQTDGSMKLELRHGRELEHIAPYGIRGLCSMEVAIGIWTALSNSSTRLTTNCRGSREASDVLREGCRHPR